MIQFSAVINIGESAEQGYIAVGETGSDAQFRLLHALAQF
jgi:hypothetical protein